ncbi:MAG TPA: hypothetical protein VI874_00805, partial [Candidatus Norongarragalinales archaeon]|nr:hypothetical protein [Candidatus Norongarragalinales archaeon]
MRLEVLEHEFNGAPFPLFSLLEATTGRWKPNLGTELDAFSIDFHGTNLRWIVDMPSWNVCCTAMFHRVEKDPDSFWQLERDVVRTCNAFWEHVQPWKTANFSGMTHAELSKQYQAYLAKLRDTFEYGVMLVLLDFSPPLLTQHLQAVAKNRFGEKANAAFITLTTNPDEQTFVKQQELDFLRILALDKKQQQAEIIRHTEQFGF